MRFAHGAPAVEFGGNLAIADLHIGVERELLACGVRLAPMIERLGESVIELIEMFGARRLWVLGDVKHTIPGAEFAEHAELRKLMRGLAERVELNIIKGNHDGDIERYAEGARVHPAGGVLADGVAMCHGHAWPGEELMKADYLLMGHSHPLIELTDSHGHRVTERAWLVGGADGRRLRERYPDANRKIRFIMMPAFNPLVGGFPFNRKGRDGLLGPLLMGDIFKLKDAKVYLLNGVGLGRLSSLKEG